MGSYNTQSSAGLGGMGGRSMGGGGGMGGGHVPSYGNNQGSMGQSIGASNPTPSFLAN